MRCGPVTDVISSLTVFYFIQNVTSFQNKPYDEAYEISQDLSMAESYDGREKVIMTEYLQDL